MKSPLRCVENPTRKRDSEAASNLFDERVKAKGAVFTNLYADFEAFVPEPKRPTGEQQHRLRPQSPGFELYRTTHDFDDTCQNPQWLGPGEEGETYPLPGSYLVSSWREGTASGVPPQTGKTPGL